MFNTVLAEAVAEGEAVVRQLGEGKGVVSDPVLELHLAIAREFMTDPESVRQFPQISLKCPREAEE